MFEQVEGDRRSDTEAAMGIEGGPVRNRSGQDKAVGRMYFGE